MWIISPFWPAVWTHSAGFIPWKHPQDYWQLLKPTAQSPISSSSLSQWCIKKSKWVTWCWHYPDFPATGSYWLLFARKWEAQLFFYILLGREEVTQGCLWKQQPCVSINTEVEERKKKGNVKATGYLTPAWISKKREILYGREGKTFCDLRRNFQPWCFIFLWQVDIKHVQLEAIVMFSGNTGSRESIYFAWSFFCSPHFCSLIFKGMYQHKPQ